MLIVDLAFLRYLIQFLKAIKLVVAICIACFVSTICERDVMIYSQTCYYIFFHLHQFFNLIEIFLHLHFFL